jgi:hypothetical protein
MKELIRNILKEYEGPKKKEYSQTSKKGLDIAMKILKQDYPFIIGWDFVKEGRFTIDLFIVCDLEEVQKFYNSKLKPYYVEKIDRVKKEDYPYTVSVLEIGEEMTNDEKFQDFMNFKNQLNDIYDMIPKEIVIKDSWGDIKQLDIEYFKFR